jgi:hypothetical protein
MLPYSLNENLLTERTDDYIAQPQPKRSNDKDAIIDRMLRRGTTLTRTDLMAALRACFEILNRHPSRCLAHS